MRLLVESHMIEVHGTDAKRYKRMCFLKMEVKL